MRPNVSAFVSGALFATGLAVGGMTLPAKVIGFLDITGDWDPSLAFVMIGAIGLNIVLFRFILKRVGPVFGGMFQLPTRKDIDPRLVTGAALFGTGWGLGGYCPGPGLVSLAGGALPALVFVLAMSVGLLLHRLGEKLRARLDAPDALPRPPSGALPCEHIPPAVTLGP